MEIKYITIVKFSSMYSVCPECGSSDYIEGIDVEYCNSCGYGIRYN